MNNKILLPQLTSLLSQNSRLPKKQADTFIKTLFTTISEAVSLHENVKIKGLGTFKVTRVEARKSVNVSTGDTVEIPAHYKLSFTPAKDLAERVNKDFSWLEIVELTDNVTNEELNSIEASQPEAPIHENEIPNGENQNEIEMSESDLDDTQISPEKEISHEIKIAQDPGTQSRPEVDGEETGAEEIAVAEGPEEREINEVNIAAAISIENEHHKETAGEELGEKLEEDFGQIEPVEPFGPVDPDDPEPGQPIPEDKFITREELLKLLSEKQSTSQYATKEDIAEAKKAMKGIRREVIDTDNRSRSSFRKSVIISIFAAAALLCGGLFLVYFLLLHKIDEKTKALAENIERIEPVPAEVKSEDAIINELTVSDNNESTPTEKTQETITTIPVETVKEQSAKPAQAQAGETSVDTKPSDVKTYDTVTKTRYLTTISRQHYGNYHFWPYIYKENEKILGHPDRIKPGTKVKVPDLAKYGVNPNKASDVAKAKKLAVEIYARYK